MLDKSIPYYHVIMKREKNTPIPPYQLTDGFTFVHFKDGDEYFWADIETSVLEFENNEEALAYFKKHYIPYKEELYKRCLFIENSEHEKVATFTIWWNELNKKLVPSIHWVAVKSEYQGLGLGKAIVLKGMELTLDIEGEKDVYCHTQTWSYQAIGVYLHAGFKLVKEGSFDHYQNDYIHAYPILKEKMKGRLVD